MSLTPEDIEAMKTATYFSSNGWGMSLDNL